MKTTVFETVYHFRRFVEDSFPGRDVELLTDRRVIKACCGGVLVDLRKKDRAFPLLRDPESYVFTHAVGRYLYGQGQNGLLVKSVRCDGINAAIFQERVLSNPRDFCYLTYFWNPFTRSPVRVERDRGTTWLEI